MATQAKTTPVLAHRRGLSGRWLVAGVVVIVIAAAAAVLVSGGSRSGAAALPATVPVSRGSLVATASGSGNIAAEQLLNLAFQSSGTVTDILVKEGDTVSAGQTLATLDARSLSLQVAAALSSLDSARARLAQAKDGNARPEDMAAARAAVASAQASYDKLTRGANESDINAAMAAVSSAQAAYAAAAASAGTTSSQMAAAKAALQKAQASVSQAQANYDRIAGVPDIGRRPESLALQSATIDYQQAKANYDSLAQTAGADATSRLDAAQAQIAQAKANLAKLTPAAEDVTAAKAGLDQAKANLAKLTAPATTTDLQIQQAAVDQADQSLKQAQLALDNATLRAPFAGIVSQIRVVKGSQVAPANPVLTLINRSPLHVDLKLTENDVARVQLGQPVTLTVQSLGGWQSNGTVSFIAPAGDNVNGVVTYIVRVNFPDSDPRVRVGMTADLAIEVGRADNVLLVPNTAILPSGTGRAVQIPAAAATGAAGARDVVVQIGISDGTNTEIKSGLAEGEQVIALPDIGTGSNSGRGGMFGGGF
jgi:HlyD family secretion protein